VTAVLGVRTQAREFEEERAKAAAAQDEAAAKAKELEKEVQRVEEKHNRSAVTSTTSEFVRKEQSMQGPNARSPGSWKAHYMSVRPFRLLLLPLLACRRKTPCGHQIMSSEMWSPGHVI